MGHGDKTFLQNVCKYIPDYIASDPKARYLYTNHNENFTSHNMQVT